MAEIFTIYLTYFISGGAVKRLRVHRHATPQRVLGRSWRFLLHFSPELPCRIEGTCAGTLLVR